MRMLLSPALALLLLASPAVAEDPPEDPDWGFTEIDQIELGEPVVGEPITHHDLRGRVVLLFQWGITCPISTGAFPAMNRLVDEFPDLVVVGFQVRRNPDVLAENVRYSLKHLRPDFPVRRLGDDWEWPAKYLPWGLLYDHTGKKIHGGSLKGIDKRIDAALEKVPLWYVGGPYADERVQKLALRFAHDRRHTGAILPDIRKLAADGSKDAKVLVTHMERWFGWQMEKAEAMPEPVSTADIYFGLVDSFCGDPLAKRASERLKAIIEDPGFFNESKAQRALELARKAFRRRPPAGTYAYNMKYTESKDAKLIETRARMFGEFRAALQRIVSQWSKTVNAAIARDLLFVHDMPFLEEDTAAKCLADAKALLEKAETQVELYDVWLLLRQIEEGYFGEDEIATGTAALRKDLSLLAKEIGKAGDSHRACDATEGELRLEVELGGSALLQADADKLIEKLMENARKAGKHSRVAKRTRAFVEALEKSYAGPASLGVVFDTRWTDTGARVQYVYPRSAAERDGIKAGDVLLAIDGAVIDSAAAVGPILSKKKPGDTVKIQVRRGRGEEAKKVDVAVVLGRSIQ